MTDLHWARDIPGALADRRLYEGGGGDRGRLCRRVRPDRPQLFPAARRSERGACSDRSEEPQEWLQQPACPDAKGLRRRVLPNAVSEKNPIVAGPLKRTDCSLVSDGAAAVVLTGVETALSMKKAVVFRAAVQINDFLPMSKRDIIQFEGCQVGVAPTPWTRAVSALDDPELRRDPRLLHYRRTPGIRSDGSRRPVARGRGQSLRAGPQKTASFRSIPQAASRLRAIRSVPPASLCTRSPPCNSPTAPATCR